MACTSFVDSQVGRVLDALDHNGYADNTIVVLWSDHGWHLGEKLITGKNTLWDPSTRVPLIFAGPSITPGGHCTQPAELLDMYPTLLELCGLPANQALEGRSLMPQLNDAAAIRERPAITTHNHDNHGVRSEDWRFIQYADGSEELYNMRDDPHEYYNLAADPRFESVRARHRGWLPTTNAPPAEGSKFRILRYKDGQPNWQGADIAAEEPVPEI
jgi:arylsulfatase A-like enzyme